MVFPELALAFFGIFVLLLMLRCCSAEIYDAVIVWMTARWYEVVFDRIEPGSRILDVGIGTATALAKNKAKVLEKRFAVVGIDYEAAYVKKAESVLRDAGLWQAAPGGTDGYRPGDWYCRVIRASVYDPGLSVLCTTDAGMESSKGFGEKPVPEELRFDIAYFSGSLTLMPDPPAALRAVVPLIKKGGQVFVTQTFNKKRSSFMSVVKPLLKYITTIDFGQLTTSEDLNKIIESAGFETLENAPMEGSLDNPWQTARLVVLRPREA